MENKIFSNSSYVDKTTSKEMMSILSQMIKSAPLELPSEWCQKNRWLSSSASANPIRYNLKYTPYLKEIMDCAYPDSPVRRVVLQKASQVGFTEMFNSIIAYLMVHFPTTIQVVLPNQKFATDFSQEKIKKMIEDNEIVRSVMTPDDTDTILSKSFRNGHLKIAGSHKTSHLKSSVAQYIFGDEIDEYVDNVGGQGNPIKLMETRARTYGARAKFFMGSSPSIKDFSKIESEFNKTDKRYFMVPCPHCGAEQSLKFSQLSYETKLYHCEHCHEGIAEDQKPWMFERGVWTPTAPKKQIDACNEEGRRGYHISALYADTSWLSWRDIIAEHQKAKADVNDMIAFKNTILGECWSDATSVPSWRKIMSNVEDYPRNRVPREVARLTAGVDIQGDRIEVSVYGWGMGFESWFIDHAVFRRTTGDGKVPDQNATMRDDIWDELEQFLLTKWQWGDDPDCKIGIEFAFVDAGFREDMAVYFCQRPNVLPFVLPIRGSNKDPGNRVKPSGKNNIWLVNVDAFKAQFYESLKIVKPMANDLAMGIRQRLYCWYPMWLRDEVYGEGFFKQLTAEKPVATGKTRRIEWQKTQDRNEALDCRIYAQAAAWHRGIHNMKRQAYDSYILSLGTPVSMKREVSRSMANKKPKRSMPESLR